ncbi:MAG: 5-dehydro-4-deoxy-D-glucuronate isomerase [Sphingomonadales bacterium]|nr:5-dehydro-4-deoxy-D-glucuronate isomerase [Sphingomonadales bacterium]
MIKFNHHGMNPRDMAGISNDELRDRFLASSLFVAGEVTLHYSFGERLMIGGAAVADAPIHLPKQSEPPSAAGRPFLDRREIGIINIGLPGTVTADGTVYDLATHECLYVGKGTGDVIFGGAGARYYLVSAPAHQIYPTKKITLSDGNILERGEVATANRRSIHQLIVPEVCESAQLALGVTFLDTGSIWNTMPPHRHARRSEIYMYFGMTAEDRVFHFMGEPDNLRPIVVGNEEAVISPPWSVHFGVGTRAYGFVWAMAGDNVDYDDMDHLTIGDLK